MNLLEMVQKTNKEPKELLIYLSEKVKKDTIMLSDFSDCLKNANSTEKGTLMEILEYVSQTHPGLVILHLDSIISRLNFDAPRVKWKAARIIANLSRKYTDKTGKAINNLLANMKDKGMVVRWSTAFTLGEIAQYNKTKQKTLVGKIKELNQEEQNNGAKKYLPQSIKSYVRQENIHTSKVYKHEQDNH